MGKVCMWNESGSASGYWDTRYALWVTARVVTVHLHRPEHCDPKQRWRFSKRHTSKPFWNIFILVFLFCFSWNICNCTHELSVLPQNVFITFVPPPSLPYKSLTIGVQIFSMERSRNSGFTLGWLFLNCLFSIILVYDQCLIFLNQMCMC